MRGGEGALPGSARQAQLEGRALPERAREGDVTAVGQRELAAHEQAEPHAAEVRDRRGALEAAEDARLVLGRDADALIGDPDPGRGRIASDDDADRASLAVL